MKVIGIKNVNFNTRDGAHIEGKSLYCTYRDNNTDGLACEKIFCSPRVAIDHVKVGSEINVLYNKYGKVDFIQVV